MIRPFETGDFARLLDLAEDMRAESPAYKDFGIVKEKLLMVGEATITLPDTYFGAVAVENEEIIGFVLGFCTEHYFTHDKIASDLALYVTPAHRGGSAAMKLIGWFEVWSRKHGARTLSLSISTGKDAERIAVLFERLGFKRDCITCKKVL